MRQVAPEVFLIARPVLDLHAIEAYLQRVGGEAWLERVEPLWQPEGPVSEGEALVEFAGRLCYRSWVPGLNPNVERVRTSIQDYLDNILTSKHGSVLEHSFYGFVFHHISRVATHEIVRHRVGTSISQESLRFVRLDNLPFWFPEWATQDEELMQRSLALLQQMEAHQQWMAQHFGLDVPGTRFGVKKFHTSVMRRFAPPGGPLSQRATSVRPHTRERGHGGLSETRLFCSDIHLHNVRAHSRVLTDGTNARLANAVGVLDSLTRYCRRESLRTVLCGGEVLHERGRLAIEVFNQARAAFRALAQAVTCSSSSSATMINPRLTTASTPWRRSQSGRSSSTRPRNSPAAG
jgi:thymidylate synthase (FAD)